MVYDVSGLSIRLATWAFRPRLRRWPRRASRSSTRRKAKRHIALQ